MGRYIRTPFKFWFALAIAAATFLLVAIGAWLWALAIVAATYSYCLFRPKRDTARAPDRPREIQSILWDFTGPEFLLAFSVPFLPVHSMFSLYGPYDPWIAIMMSGLCFFPLCSATCILLLFVPLASVRIVKILEAERIIHRFVVFSIHDNVKMQFLWLPDGDSFLVAAQHETGRTLYRATFSQEGKGDRLPGGTWTIGKRPFLYALEYSKYRDWFLRLWGRFEIDPSECVFPFSRPQDSPALPDNYEEEARFFFLHSLITADGFPNKTYFEILRAEICWNESWGSRRERCEKLLDTLPKEYTEYAKLLIRAKEKVEAMKKTRPFPDVGPGA